MIRLVGDTAGYDTESLAAGENAARLSVSIGVETFSVGGGPPATAQSLVPVAVAHDFRGHGVARQQPAQLVQLCFVVRVDHPTSIGQHLGIA